VVGKPEAAVVGRLAGAVVDGDEGLVVGKPEGAARKARGASGGS